MTDLNPNSYMTFAQAYPYIAHHGVKGMHWGVRRKAVEIKKDRFSKEERPVRVTTKPGRKVKTAGGQRQQPHEDAITSAVLERKAKVSTTDSLSNRELQTLVNRMNLEQQYSNLASKRQPKYKKAFQRLLRSEGKRALNDPQVMAYTSQARQKVAKNLATKTAKA